MMVGHFGSGIWMPCLSRGPDKDGSSSSLMDRTFQNYHIMHLLPTLSIKIQSKEQWEQLSVKG